MEIQYFDCQCHTPEHTIRLVIDPEYGDLHLEVFLGDNVWYMRIWKAIKYVFGYKCRYGHYDCTLLKPEDYERLEHLMKRSRDIIEKNKENEK